MIESVIAELLASTTIRMATQLHIAVRERKGRSRADDFRIHAALSQFRIEDSLLRAHFDLPRGVREDEIVRILRSPEAAAIAFELLSIELTDSHELSTERIERDWGELVAKHCRDCDERFADGLLRAITDNYNILTSHIRETFPSEYASLRNEAHFRRLACILEAIRREATAATSRPLARELDAFTDLYARQLRHAHNSIIPPDFDRRRRVPIDELYVSPTIVDSADSEATFPDLLLAVDRTVLLGDPGGGKSTASEVLIHRLARSPGGEVPFLVRLRDYAQVGGSVVDYIRRRVSEHYSCTPPANAVEHLLESGRALVIFDGLDELLDTSLRISTTEVVSLFANRFPLARVLVTSRVVGYQQAPMDPGQFHVLNLRGFSRAQVADYVQRWFLQEDLSAGEAASWAASFMAESESIHDLTRTPLLLALLCIIYRGEESLPRSRPAVYERCSTMMFEKWDSQRKIHVELRARHLIDPALKHLAYWMFAREPGRSERDDGSEQAEEGVTESDLVRETAKYLHERSFEDDEEARIAAEEFIEFCRGRAWVFSDVGTTAEGESLYSFTHRTFLEYFAAHHLVRSKNSPEELAWALLPKLASAEWDVVAQLAVQISDRQSDLGASRIFKAVLNERGARSAHERANMLAFLGRCLTFVQVSPQVQRQLVSRALDLALNSEGQRDPLLAIVGSATPINSRQIRQALEEELDKTIACPPWSRARQALVLCGSVEPLIGLARVRDDLSSDWMRGFRALAERHRSRYMSHLGKDLPLSHAALRIGSVSVEEYLSAFDRGLDPLFATARLDVIDATYHSYAEYLLKQLGRDPRGDELANLELQLEETANYGTGFFDSHGWLFSASKPDIYMMRPKVPEEPQGANPPSQVEISEKALLGVGLLLAIISEQYPVHSEVLDRIRVPEGLLSWFDVSGGADQRQGPDARDSMFGLLQAWRRGDIRFTKNRPLVPRPPGRPPWSKRETSA